MRSTATRSPGLAPWWVVATRRLGRDGSSPSASVAGRWTVGPVASPLPPKPSTGPR